MKTRLFDRGYSIIELTLVVAVIAVISVIAVPNFSEVHIRRLQVASSETEAALRFARHEAIRTGIPHGVRKISGQNALSVFRMNMEQDPPVEIHDVVHPLDSGQPYRLSLDSNRSTLETTVTAHFNIFGDNASHQAISFNMRGEPIDGVTGKTLSSPQGGFLLNNGNRGTQVSVTWLAGIVATTDIGAAINDPAIVF